MQNKIIIIGLVLYAITSLLHAGWIQQHLGSNTLYDIDFPFNDVNNGFACGANSFLLMTTNGGDNWIQNTQIEPSGNFNAINFPQDPSTGYIACDSGNVQITSDGGNNWLKVSTGTHANLKGIHFINPSTGYVLGEAGTVLKTMDGGVSWEPKPPQTSLDFYGLFVLDEQRVFVVGDSGAIFHTTDAGGNWEQIVVHTSARLLDIYFKEDNNGWAVGAAKTFLMTTDGGLNWDSTNLPLPNNTDLKSVIFPMDNQIGFISGTFGKISKTTDGGVSWTTTNLLYGLNHIEFPQDAMVGWVCGQNEAIYKTTNGGEPAIAETNLNQTESEEAFSCIPNPFRTTTGIRFSSSANCRPSSPIRIYNINGRLVKSYSLSAASGQRSVESGFVWNGRDELNQTVAPGVYLLEYKTNGNKSEHFKLTVLE